MIQALRLMATIIACALIAALPPAARAAEPGPGQVMVMLRLPPAHFRTGTAYASGYGDDGTRGWRLRTAGRIARNHKLKLLTNWPMPTLGVECFVMAVPAGQKPDDVAQSIGQDSAVAWSEPVAAYSTQGAKTEPTDGLYAAQPAAHEWPLAELHRTLTGRDVTVAVIDSGVDMRQPDLVGQVVMARNFASSAYLAENHGTAVAGLIAARAGNHVGITGIAPDARIMALRACAQTATGTFCDSFSLAKAIQFALERRAPIINLSLSGPPSKLLADLLKQGIDHGLTVVAAVDVDAQGGGFPASLPGVIAVRGENIGRSAILAYNAPARDIPVPQPGGKWALVNGNSYAAAHVSGLMALLRQSHGQEGRLRLAPAVGGPIDFCATFGGRTCTASASSR